MSERIEKLKQYADCWETSIGAWFPGERVVFRGKDLHKDLSELTFCQILYFAASGKLYEGLELFFMDTANTICSSFPDPRIWNNRIGALAGTTRCPASLAISAANAVSDANVYGGHTQLRASDFLYRAMKKKSAGKSVEDIVDSEFKAYRSLAGYGRPVTRKDERIGPLLLSAEKANLHKGEFLKLAFEIEEYLVTNRRRIKLNINGVLAALMADQGLEPYEFYLFCLVTFSPGILACYVDAVDHEEGAFFPFAANTINYEGEAERSW